MTFFFFKIVDTGLINKNKQTINELIDKVTENVIKKVDEQTLELSNKFNEMKIEIQILGEMMEKLDKKLQNYDINRPEATFVFESNNITAFLEDPSVESMNFSKNYRMSEFFYIRGIAWYIKFIVVKKDDDKKYLKTFLAVHNPLDDSNWSVDAFIRLRIINQSGKRDEFYGTTKNKFDKNDLTWGYSNYISVDDLKNKQFIKNDTIKIEVYVKTDKLIRNWEIY